MGKASRTKAERRQGSVSQQAKKANGTNWVFPAIIIGVVVVFIAGTALLLSNKSNSAGKVNASGYCEDVTKPVDRDKSGDPEKPDAASLVGKQATKVSGKNCVDGKDVTIMTPEGTGKPTLLVFWANWCPHCQRELPIIEQIYKDNKSKWNVGTVGTAISPNQSALEGVPEQFKTPQAFINTQGMTMPTILDPSGKYAAEWQIGGFPQLFYIDSKGKIVDQTSGELPEDQITSRMAKLS